MKRSDEELVARTLEGDTGAFAELVERYRDAAYGVGLHMLGDPHEAAELAQDAFIRAWRALHQLREPAKFPAWLCQIARNLARRRLSARAAAADAISLEKVEEMAAQRKPPPDNAQESEMISIVRQLVETLRDDQRLAFTLFYVNGYSYGDLSKMLDLPEGTVKTQLHRARARLKRGFVEMAKEAMQKAKPDAEFWRSATGTITGRVTSAPTGEPVEGAEVKLYETQTVTFASGTSGPDGVWEAQDLLPGAYVVSVHHPEFVPFSGLDWGNVRVPVVVRPGQTVQDLDLQLHPAAHIRGRVLAEDGSALADASVSTWCRQEPPRGEIRFDKAGGIRTDNEGHFDVGGIPAGDYLVGVQKVSVDQLVAGRPVTYYNGTFSLYDAEWVTTSPEKPCEGIVFAPAQRGTTALQLQVSDKQDGSPISGARVLVCRRDVAWDMFEGQTDSTGAFQSPMLTAGPFQVLVEAYEQGYPRWSKWIDVPSGTHRVALDFGLPRGAVLEARVRTEDGSELPSLEHLNCWLHPVCPDRQESGVRTKVGVTFVSDDRKTELHVPLQAGRLSQSMRVEEVDRLVSRPVAPGEVSVQAWMRDKEWRVAGVLLNEQALDKLEVGPGDRIDSLEIVLGSNLGIVAGRVLSSADNAPQQGVCVQMTPQGNEPGYLAPARTDRSGSFFFHSIPAGEYMIGVSRSPVDRVEEGTERDITVEAGKVVHLDLVLPEQ